MIAFAPGGGDRRTRTAIAETAVYALGVATGGQILAVLLQLAGHTLSLPSLLVVVALGAAASAAWMQMPVPGSGWMVPRSWVRIGRLPYVFVFGVILGFGLLTSLPGIGFLPLMAFAASAEWGWGAAAMLVFGLSRSLPMILRLRPGARSSAWHTAYSSATLASALTRAEPVLLTALLIASLVSLESPH